MKLSSMCQLVSNIRHSITHMTFQSTESGLMSVDRAGEVCELLSWPEAVSDRNSASTVHGMKR